MQDGRSTQTLPQAPVELYLFIYFLFFVLCHLPFLTASKMYEGLVAAAIEPYAVDRGRVSAIGCERLCSYARES